MFQPELIEKRKKYLSYEVQGRRYFVYHSDNIPKTIEKESHQ